MPNWKKVAVSGSAASFTSLSIDTSITASIVSSSQFIGNLTGTASFATSASYAPGSGTSVTASYALTASYVENAQTASYVQNAVSASHATTSSFAISASYAPGSGTSVTASYALTASYVENAISSSYALSASYAPGSGTSVTASYALTASYVQNAITSSYALTASYVSGAFNSVTSSYAQSASNFVVTDTLTITAALIKNTTVNSSILGSNIAASQATGSYSSAFFQYTATSASNARAGQVTAVWNNDTTTYTDFSTTDIGSTTAVTASVSLLVNTLQFNVQTNTAGWKIKTLATYL